MLILKCHLIVNHNRPIMSMFTFLILPSTIGQFTILQDVIHLNGHIIKFGTKHHMHSYLVGLMQKELHWMIFVYWILRHSNGNGFFILKDLHQDYTLDSSQYLLRNLFLEEQVFQKIYYWTTCGISQYIIFEFSWWFK